MSAKKGQRKAAKGRSGSAKKSGGFSSAEREAMRERARELKAEGSGGRGTGKRAGKADGESAMLAAIAAMPEPDRVLATRLHALVMASAPALAPKTWYGMPAWARDGKVVCFFQGAKKFESRYPTFGFSDNAKLDDGNMWPTAFGLTDLTAAEEARIVALVKKAVG